jgi:hypothetical protein
VKVRNFRLSSAADESLSDSRGKSKRADGIFCGHQGRTKDACKLPLPLLHREKVSIAALPGKAKEKMTLTFMRNKVVEVEPLSEKMLSVSWRLVDTLMASEIHLKIRLPDLEIAEAEARMARFPHPACSAVSGLIEKVIGVRVGPGLQKIVSGLVGDPLGCRELAEGVLECCNAVILHFTLPQLQAIEKGDEMERRRGFQDMLKSNPRLVRSCVAFADDSPLMEGLKL